MIETNRNIRCLDQVTADQFNDTNPFGWKIEPASKERIEALEKMEQQIKHLKEI